MFMSIFIRRINQLWITIIIGLSHRVTSTGRSQSLIILLFIIA